MDKSLFNKCFWFTLYIIFQIFNIAYAEEWKIINPSKGMEYKGGNLSICWNKSNNSNNISSKNIIITLNAKNESQFKEGYILADNVSSDSKCYNYNIIAKKEENGLDLLNIENEENCKKLIPSLFHPILLVYYDYFSNKIKNNKKDLTLNIPFLSPDSITGSIYHFEIGKFFNDLGIYLAKNDDQSDTNCYFGLSLGFPNDTVGLNVGEDSLSYLMKNGDIKEPIFSFDKFKLNENSIDTTLYYGESHKHFNGEEGIIGFCNNNEEDNFWGCSFEQMIFNNINIPLKKDNKLYKIYFTTETYTITFPSDLNIKKIFEDNTCKYKCLKITLLVKTFLKELIIPNLN